MNGAESLVRTLVVGGVEVCFTNPGTSEMHIIAALDRTPAIRCVLGLFEGVVTAAADGYARMTGNPACTLLHLGPGLANGIANLHNARRARVPMVNLVGQHARNHLQFDSPLTSDIQGLARTFSNWVRTARTTSELGTDTSDAIFAARMVPGHIASLIVPADVAWGEGGAVAASPQLLQLAAPSSETIERTAKMLRSDRRTALLLSGTALYGKGLATAGRIAAQTGAKLFAPYPFPRMERGAVAPSVERIAYVYEQAVTQLKEFRQLILVGAAPPVSYFASPDRSSVPVPPECEVFALATPEEDSAKALEALAAGLSLRVSKIEARKLERPHIPAGEISLASLASAVAALLPDHTIVVDESMTSGRGMMAATENGPPHDWLANTGGSIGIALPLAVGAAIACPARRVLCLSADGSGMYTLQALWTLAREGLNVTTVIFANRAYSVLKREFSYLGVGAPGKCAQHLFEIGQPDLDWVSLARGMGVPGIRVATMEAFGTALKQGFECNGPTLIEVPV